MKKALVLIVVLAMAFAAFACGTTVAPPAVDEPVVVEQPVSEPATDPAAEPAVPDITIKVGSKDFTEQLILGQLSILALKDAGYKVEDKTNVSGSDTCRTALTTGEFDLYWEYTGTAWAMLLKNETMLTDSQGLFDKVKEADAANGITWLQYAPLNNTYALVMPADLSAEYGITSYSELAAYITANPGKLFFACDHEFTARPDGLPGLETVYGMDFGESIAIMDMGLVFAALKDGQAQVSMVFATDGRIKANGLTLLKDDKSFYPIYNAAPSVRTDTLEKAPGIQAILEKIAVLLTDEVMQDLNAKVDIDGFEPVEVAEEFLKANGLIK